MQLRIKRVKRKTFLSLVLFHFQWFLLDLWVDDDGELKCRQREIREAWLVVQRVRGMGENIEKVFGFARYFENIQL